MPADPVNPNSRRMTMILADEKISPRPALSPEKRALLEKRLRGDGAQKREHQPGIPRRDRSSNAPLSFAQQRLWFFDQLQPHSPLYNLPVALRLRGRLNRNALHQAINAIAARHEALRTRFESEDGSPVQMIDGPAPVELPLKDLAREPESQRDKALQRLLDEETSRPFDLSRGELLRALLVRLGETDHVLALTMHHIVSDAWSLGVFFRELAELYETFVDGRSRSLPELPVQYADFAAWQREQMRGEAMEKQLAFWKRHLAGAPQFLELPT